MHLSIVSYCYSAPVQISTSVSQRWSMTAMGMLTAGILLAVMIASAGADMRETVSTAQVIQHSQSALVAMYTHKLRFVSISCCK